METNPSQIRYSSIAGSWYPGDREILAKMLDHFLGEADYSALDIDASRLLVLFVPHAGYIYSGGVAANAYRLLVDSKFERVVLMGPSHYQYFSPWATTTFTHYQTPLGLVAVDELFIEKIGGRIALPRISENQEHSLEVQLPFLQRTLQDFTIAPILSGDQSLESARALAEALAETIADGQTLVIASSDLSHYHNAATAEQLDLRVISRLESLDAEGLAGDLEAGDCEACGGGAILTAMLFSRMRGAEIKTLKYAHSGMVTGINWHVVGYLATAAFTS